MNVIPSKDAPSAKQFESMENTEENDVWGKSILQTDTGHLPQSEDSMSMK